MDGRARDAAVLRLVAVRLNAELLNRVQNRLVSAAPPITVVLTPPSSKKEFPSPQLPLTRVPLAPGVKVMRLSVVAAVQRKVAHRLILDNRRQLDCCSLHQFALRGDLHLLAQLAQLESDVYRDSLVDVDSEWRHLHCPEARPLDSQVVK